MRVHRQTKSAMWGDRLCDVRLGHRAGVLLDLGYMVHKLHRKGVNVHRADWTLYI